MEWISPPNVAPLAPGDVIQYDFPETDAPRRPFGRSDAMERFAAAILSVVPGVVIECKAANTTTMRLTNPRTTPESVKDTLPQPAPAKEQPTGGSAKKRKQRERRRKHAQLRRGRADSWP